uniref:uncharacterized protein LOC120330169 n=1 Tax=Styela clava TaxID=7725 RepID=UPI001939CE2F|nr:uncharacterized protein LOC120330169 [Styela clava]XP_039252958.1 uncharacterized protein LOC120330169 [Styela clava]
MKKIWKDIKILDSNLLKRKSRAMTGSTSQKQYTMKPQGTEKYIFRLMNQQRRENGSENCEVILLTKGIKHFGHKTVLKLYSEFFRQYFEDEAKNKLLCGNDTKSTDESDKLIKYDQHKPSKVKGQNHTTIHLPGINSEELSPILEYMYGSKLSLKAENVNEILFVGCLLQIPTIIEFCSEVLLEQPDWRSPLVSEKIHNFAKTKDLKEDNSKRHGGIHVQNVPPTSTDVTWTTEGIRTTTLQPLKINTNTKEDSICQETEETNRPKCNSATLHDDSTIQHNVRRLLVAQHKRKRQYPWTNASSGELLEHRNVIPNIVDETFISEKQVAMGKTETRNGNKRCSGSDFYSQKYARLNSEMTGWIPSPFMPSNTADTMFLPKHDFDPTRNVADSFIPVSTNFMETTSVVGKKLLPKLSYPNSAKMFQMPFRSSDYIEEQLPKNKQANCLGVESARSFPQINGLNQNLTTAYAPTLALPIFHHGYFGYPMIESVGALGHLSNLSGFYNEVMPSNTQYDYAIRQLQSQKYVSKAETNFMACSTQNLCPPPLIDKRYAQTLFQRNPSTLNFCNSKDLLGGVIDIGSYGLHMTGEDDINQASKPLNLVCKPNDKLQQHGLDVENKLHFDVQSTKFSSIPVPESDTICKSEDPGAQHASSTNETPLNTQKHTLINDTYVDYHKRKRKYLRAAGIESSGFSKTDAVKSPHHQYNKVFEDEGKPPAVQRGQCSSEDNIITRECHQMDVSEPESDDSGRPSSV